MSEKITSENHKKIARRNSRRFPSIQKWSIPSNIESLETLTTKEAAIMLDLNEQTILYHIKKRHLRAYKTYKYSRWLIDKKSAVSFKKILDMTR